MMEHFRRWEVAELERRQWGDPRNNKTDWKAVVATRLTGTNAECGEETVKKSHQLIKRAGGRQVTLASYKLAVKERDRRRKKRRKKI